jgi:UDPglucose 6-dehydrogenase
MSEIGFLGLGKLGLPVALAIESMGHSVLGYDIDPKIMDAIRNRAWPFQEESVPELLSTSAIRLTDDVGELVAASDIIFCPIQTPHHPDYEGTTRLPKERTDFDYTYLKEAVTSVAREADSQDRHTTLAVISTCLPGTFEREIRALLSDRVDYVYTPQFIAMGTVINDFLHPEFALIGVDRERAATKLGDFYKTLFDRPHLVTDITTAEGIKVSYNTWITAKTVIANVWGEIAHKTGMNFDDIHRGWSLASERLISTKYMQAGVGDGGGCHPRDNIALSHLARELDLSHDIFEDLMTARESHMEWLANVAMDAARERNLPIIVLGRSFKPGTQIETGSPSVLMASMIREMMAVQHFEDLEPISQPAVYVIGTQHDRYRGLRFPDGSAVVDPFGYIEPQDGVDMIRIGRPVVDA